MVMSWKTNEAYTSKIKYKCMSKEVIHLCMLNTQN
jgi:hypothetical protein